MLPSCIGGAERFIWPVNDDRPLWACRCGPACLAHATRFGTDKRSRYRLSKLASISTRPLLLTTHTCTHTTDNNTHTLGMQIGPMIKATALWHICPPCRQDKTGLSKNVTTQLSQICSQQYREILCLGSSGRH